MVRVHSVFSVSLTFYEEHNMIEKLYATVSDIEELVPPTIVRDYNVSEMQTTLKDAKDFVEGVLCREDSPYKGLVEHKKISMIKFVRQQAQFIEELNEENDALRRELSLLIELSSLKYRDRGFSREIRNLSPCGLTRLLTLVKKSNIDTDDIESYVDELVRLES